MASPPAEVPPAQSSASPGSPATATSPAPATVTVSDQTILPASYWQQAAERQDDQGNDDADSTMGSLHESTASLTSSILHYRTIHGRTYAGDRGKAEAWEPNDDAHLESMDINHHLCTLAMDGKLHLAPLKKDIQKVLDIGTGTGIWAIDFADEYPTAEVIGTDVAPMQPSWVPPNCKFEIDDANEEEWTWPENSIDFVHCRILLGCIIDWSAFYKEAFRICKPGGYLEHYEASVKWDSDDGSVKDDSPMGQWSKVFWEGGKKFGRSFRVIEDDIQTKYMREAGFVDITVKEMKIPVGSWPKDPKQKELGLFARSILDSDAEGYVLYMWRSVMGWSQEEVQVFVAHLRRQLRDPKVHPWYSHRIVFGRKPE